MTAIEPREIRIAALVLDAKFQFRAAIDPRKVEEYAIAYDLGADFRPVEVAMVNGAAVLVDGWHRIAALKKLGRNTVWATVEEMSEADALWRAAMANLGHGLNLKPAERNRALQAALAAYVRARRHLKGKGQAKSFREIAQELGGHVDFGTVRRWLYRFHPKVAARYWGENAVATSGGLREQVQDTPVNFGETARDSLDHALAAFQGVTSPHERGALIAKAQEIVEAMKGEGEWTVDPFWYDF